MTKLCTLCGQIDADGSFRIATDEEFFTSGNPLAVMQEHGKGLCVCDACDATNPNGNVFCSSSWHIKDDDNFLYMGEIGTTGMGVWKKK